MQSLVLPPSFVASDLGRLRYPYPERHLFNRPRSPNARRCTPRDLPLPYSMSSSAAADDPLETLGNVRRPGHPDLPTPVTTTAVTSGVSSTISGPAPSPAPSHPVTPREPPLQRIATAPGDELRQPFAFGEPFSTARFPPQFTGQPSSGPSVATYPQPVFGAATAGPASRALPQKTTRRTKAHVASACVNCKKKHLGCDPARPCRRCVLSGKADTCVDVTHKKRGRPPLKADEGSIRTYASQMDRNALGEQGPARRPMHRATSSRELRPTTDLQIPGAQPAMMGARLPPGQPQRWPGPVVYPHPQTIDPSLTQRTMGHQRYSSSGSAQSLTAVSPTGYVAMPVGYNPALAAGRMPAGVGRPMASYPPGMHPTPSPPQYNPPYGVPISPYLESRVGSRMPMGEPSGVPVAASRDPRETYAESPVRLPPIYPSPVTNPQSLSQPQPQTHRPSEPYPTMWSPQQHQIPGHQPAFAEPISPHSQMRQAASDVGQHSSHGHPQGLGLVSASEGPSQQIPPTRTRTYYEQRDREGDEEDSSRPAKRRKMALDDMVND